MFPVPLKRKAFSPVGEPVHLQKRLPLPRIVGGTVFTSPFYDPVVLTNTTIEILGGTAVRVSMVFGSNAVGHDHDSESLSSSKYIFFRVRTMKRNDRVWFVERH